MKKTYNWDRVERHLREALGSLRNLHDCAIQEGRSFPFYKRGFRDGVFAAELEHVYHHLNFAWNSRFMDEKTAESDFQKHEKWPQEFERFFSNLQV